MEKTKGRKLARLKRETRISENFKAPISINILRNLTSETQSNATAKGDKLNRKSKDLFVRCELNAPPLLDRIAREQTSSIERMEITDGVQRVSSVTALKGMLRKPRKPVPIEAMNVIEIFKKHK